MKKFSLIGMLLLLLLGVVGCESAVQEMGYDNEEAYYEEVDFSEKAEKLCLYLRNNDMDSALFLINEFLATLPNDECVTLYLREWLESVPSITEVFIGVLTLPALSATCVSIARVRLFMGDEDIRSFQVYFTDPPTAKK